MSIFTPPAHVGVQSSEVAEGAINLLYNHYLPAQRRSAKEGDGDAFEFIKILDGADGDADKYSPCRSLAEWLKFPTSMELAYHSALFYRPTATNYAARRGHLEVLKKLHKMKCKLNDTCVDPNPFLKRRTPDFVTPLMLASKYGHIECVKFIVENRTELTDFDYMNNATKKVSALTFAASAGHLDCVKYLIENRVEKVDSGTECEAIQAAAINGHVDCVKYIAGYRPPETYAYARDRLFEVLERAAECRSAEVLKNVVAFSPQFLNLSQNTTSGISFSFGGETITMMVAKLGFDDCLKVLIDAGVNVNESGREGNQAIHYPVMNYKVNKPSGWGQQFLPVKRFNEGHIACLQMLLKNGAIIDAQNTHNGKTPIHYATMYKNTEALRFLIKEGANLNIQENLKWNTPLHIAVNEDDAESVKILVESGANIELENVDGQTPKDVAKENVTKHGRRQDRDKWYNAVVIEAILDGREPDSREVFEKHMEAVIQLQNRWRP